MHIEVSIGRLILDGFPAEEREAIRRAFSSELARLLAGGLPSAPQEDQNLVCLDAGSFPVGDAEGPGYAAALGTRAARALYRKL